MTLGRGVGAYMADTCRGPIHGEGCRALPLRACGALLDLAGKREHGNSDQVISTGPIYPIPAATSRSDQRWREKETL
jgi:hypothetical protein